MRRELFLDLIYQAASDPSGWSAVVEAISEHVAPGGVAALFSRDLNLGADAEAMVLRGYDASDVEHYRDYFAARDVRLPDILPMQSGTVAVDGRDLDFRRVQRSEIYADFYRPLRVDQGMALKLFQDDRRVGVMTFHRPRGAGAFSIGQVSLLEDLAPHIVRAFQVGRQVTLARQQAEAFRFALDHFRTAVFLVRRDLRVADYNRQAETLLAEEVMPLSIQQNMLCGSAGNVHASLQAAVSQAVDHPVAAGSPPLTLALTGKDAAKVSLMVIAARRSVPVEMSFFGDRHALVFISVSRRTPLPPTDGIMIALQFGLSRAEAAIAAELAVGHSLDQIAAHRSVSKETVRSQIKAVFSKANVRSQAQLVSVMSHGLGALDRADDRS